MQKLILTECKSCNEWWCMIHKEHYAECGCPPIDECDVEVLE